MTYSKTGTTAPFQTAGPRQPIQLVVTPVGEVIALCSDGSVWAMNPDPPAGRKWERMPDVPRPKPADLIG